MSMNKLPILAAAIQAAHGLVGNQHSGVDALPTDPAVVTSVGNLTDPATVLKETSFWHAVRMYYVFLLAAMADDTGFPPPPAERPPPVPAPVPTPAPVAATPTVPPV